MRVVAMFLLVCSLVARSAPSSAQDSAFGSSRGSATDFADLANDLGAFFNAQCRLGRLTSSVRNVLSFERQRQMLGVEGPSTLEAFRADLKKFWKNNIVDRGLRIAANPATPCQVAQLVLTKMYETERQAQLLGATGSEDISPEMNLREPTSDLSKALMAIKRRCLEQAFDACMESGNGQHILMMLAEAGRQFQLLSIEDPDFESQAVYLFRRCTVYQLRFHSQSRVAAKSFTFGATYDGSTILLSDVDPAGGYAGLAGGHEWKGPRPSDPDDVITSVTECTSPARRTTMACELPQPKFPAQARISFPDLNMKRYYDEFAVSAPDCANDLTYTELLASGKGSGRITATRKADGKDELKLTYGPGMVITLAQLSSRDMTLPALPMPPSRTVCLTAHTGARPTTQEITLEQWTRTGKPVLFEKSISGEATVDKIHYKDTTKLELVHRPDLFPAEEIVPGWELAAPE
jgi:hypothetical protein